MCHVPIAEGVSTFYILFQPKCNRRFIFTWSVIYFTVFYANFHFLMCINLSDMIWSIFWKFYFNYLRQFSIKHMNNHIRLLVFSYPQKSLPAFRMPCTFDLWPVPVRLSFFYNVFNLSVKRNSLLDQIPFFRCKLCHIS